jgi:hypothetical protein
VSAIDTVFEYAGYSLAGRLTELFSAAGLPLLLGLGGVAWSVARVAERGGVSGLGVHVLYLFLAWWLLSPAPMQEMKVPRFVGYLGQAADVLQKRAVKAIDEDFLTSPFEWERVSAMAAWARILDPRLGNDAAEFLEACAKPALAVAEPRGANLFREGVLTYMEPCERARAELWRRIQEHVDGDPIHRATLEAVRRREPGRWREFRERYLEEVARRAVDDPGSPTHEMRLAVEALGSYSWTAEGQSVGEAEGAPGFLEKAVNFVVSGVAALTQDVTDRFSAKQKYYIAVSYGPAIYGLSLMLLAGLFPVAGLWALLPGRWGTLVSYGKVFVSVKLWPVGWAALTAFTSRRSSLEAFEPGGWGIENLFLGVSAMYFLVPALSFLVVNLAARAAALPFGEGTPVPAGPGLGAAAAVARAAARK